MIYNFNRNSENKISPIHLEFSKIKDQFHLYDLLSECWSVDTCAPRLRDKWNKDNKTCGQCSITAFIVQDIFGGEVYGVETCSGTHCFNKIGDVIFDLTSEQFENASQLKYTLDNPQNRDTHFIKEEKYQRYLLLKKLLENKIQSLNKDIFERVKNNIGYCGLDCSKCDCYIATVNNDDELRKKTAQKWSELNGVEIPYKAMNCLGCTQDGIKSIFCSKICEVRKCAITKQISCCDKCSKIDNCDKVKPFLKSPNNVIKRK